MPMPPDEMSDGTPTGHLLEPTNAVRPRCSGWTAIGPTCSRNCGSSRPVGQLLTGSLLTLLFQSRFQELSQSQQKV